MLNLKEPMFLYFDHSCSEAYFIEKRLKPRVSEEVNPEEELRLLCVQIKTDDDIRQEFYDNYDYKENRIYAVSHEGYEDSLDTYRDEIDENYREYLDSCIDGYSNSIVSDYIQENIDNENYDYQHLELTGDSSIQIYDNGEYNNHILNSIINRFEDNQLGEYDKINSDALLELQLFFNRGNYEYVQI